ncbi:MAG TPA: class I adenylate-forming enzyme family protein [Rhizomicrobium sp.]|nr:class I adenylate-forming enzyme family protein [Rhizomicrobium sp.]
MLTRQDVLSRLTQTGQFELGQDHSLGYPIRVYRNAPPSMRAILESTRQFGDRTFLVYGDETITFAEHFGKVAALAEFLMQKGVRKGDRVAVGMRNYPEWMIGFWACQAIGAVVVALNAWWTGPELSYALDDSGASALIVDGERLERLAPELDKWALKAVVVARRSGFADEGVAFSEVTRQVPDRLPEAEVEPGDFATILYTSGTTGKPKGAVATHRNHVTNYMNTLLAGAVAKGMLGDFSALNLKDVPQAGILQTFPFFHIGGMSGLYLATGTGAKVALMYKWHPAEAVELVARHRLNSVAGVPLVVRQLLEQARTTGADVSSLVGIASGGASVPPDLIRQIGRQFEMKTSPSNGYGLTETTSAVVTNSGADYHAQPDSIGRPVVTADVKIVDETGNELGDDQIGELLVRGPNVIPGYWNNPEATELAFGGGWFRTGDLGYRDSRGFHYVVDRKKDVIIRGGENVYCAEVEAAILEHPQVKDVAVVGVPDAEYGEQVAAVIQVRDAARSDMLARELQTALAGSLAQFKIPTAFRMTEADLPRTATGKVLKRELRSLFTELPSDGKSA